MQNAILTKLSMWEYGNGVCPIFTVKIRQSFVFGALWRIGKVSRLYRHARTMMSRSPSKHEPCWCVSHIQGNQCHLVTWIKTITSLWLCTQYSMNMHLWQSPWAYTHTTRSSALMIREGHSWSHKRLWYKVHNHPHTPKHIYIYIYIYTSCTMLP